MGAWEFRENPERLDSATTQIEYGEKGYAVALRSGSLDDPTGTVLRVQCLAKTTEINNPVLRYRNIGLYRLFFRTA